MGICEAAQKNKSLWLNFTNTVNSAILSPQEYLAFLFGTKNTMVTKDKKRFEKNQKFVKWCRIAFSIYIDFYFVAQVILQTWYIDFILCVA